MDYPKELEQRLCRLMGRKYCIYVAGATAGMVLVLRAAGIRNQPVALPAGVCSNVPLAVMYSGNIPLYLDHEPAALGMSPDDLAIKGAAAKAVIAVHAYGNPCMIERISAWCRQRGSFLLEDLAPALGATLNGQPAGSFGDAAVVSFGAGKIIDVGGGGAVLTDDPALAKAVETLNNALPAHGVEVHEAESLGNLHTKLYNAHYGNDLNARAQPFRDKALVLEAGFVHLPDPERARMACHALDDLATNIILRRSRWDRLAQLLANARLSNASIQPLRTGDVPWRLNLLMSSGRGAVLKHLLAANLKVSSWFPPSDLYFVPGRGDGDGSTPVASKIGREILNLWVNDEVGEDYPRRITEAIKQGVEL